MINHYENTYAATHRYEIQRNRFFVILILVLIGSTYLAFDKEVARVAFTLIVTQFPAGSTDVVQAAIKRVNFYRIFSIVSTLAIFYLRAGPEVS